MLCYVMLYNIIILAVNWSARPSQNWMLCLRSSTETTAVRWSCMSSRDFWSKVSHAGASGGFMLHFAQMGACQRQNCCGGSKKTQRKKKTHIHE